MGHDTFICYDCRDKHLADAVCAALEANAVRCWIAPRDLTDFPPGGDGQDVIAAAIRASTLMVAVVPCGDNPSHQFSREIGEAIAGGILVVPFRVGEAPAEEPSAPEAGHAPEAGQPPPDPADSHWMEDLTPALERRLRQLASGVRALLGADGGGPRLAPAPALPVPTPASREPLARNRRGRRRHFRLAVLSGLTSGAVAAVIASIICWAVWRPPAGATHPTPPSAASAAPPAVRQEPPRGRVALADAGGPASTRSAAPLGPSDAPPAPRSSPRADAAVQALALYRHGLRLEQEDPAAALAEYAQIRRYPRSVWPADLELRIRHAESMRDQAPAAGP